MLASKYKNEYGFVLPVSWHWTTEQSWLSIILCRLHREIEIMRSSLLKLCQYCHKLVVTIFKRNQFHSTGFYGQKEWRTSIIITIDYYTKIRTTKIGQEFHKLYKLILFLKNESYCSSLFGYSCPLFVTLSACYKYTRHHLSRKQGLYKADQEF